MLDRELNDKPYLIGRATSLVEDILGTKKLPGCFVELVAINPLDKLKYHADKAVRVSQNNELIDIATRIGNLPAMLTKVEQGQFYIGYYHQKADKNTTEN